MSQKSLDDTMKDLLEVAKKIISLKVEDNLFATKKEKKKSSKDPLLKYLENYEEDYYLNDDEGNKEDIMHAYKKYRAALLRGWKNDTWLKNGSVVIFSGSIEPDDKRKVPLSAIYNIACRQRDERKVALAELPVEAYDGVEELLYPSFLQLHMYCVFLLSLDGEEYSDDITKLGLNVSELEKELKITSNNSSIVPISADSLSGIGDGLMGMATDFASKMGFNVPEGMDINQETIMNVASGFLNNPDMQGLMQDFSETMKGSRDFSDAIPKALNKFNDPATKEKFQKVIGGMLPKQEQSVETQ